MIVLKRLTIIIGILLLAACGRQPVEDLELDPNPIQKTPGLLTAIAGDSSVFPDTETLQTSTLDIAIRNIGEEDVTNLSVSGLDSLFSFTGGTYPGTGGNCPETLAGATSCTLSIDFAPTLVGAASVDMILSFSTANASNNIQIGLSGNGVLPAPPVILGLADDAQVTNEKVQLWSCDQDCEYRYTINQNSTHVFSAEIYGADLTTTHSSGNGSYYLHIQAKSILSGIESTMDSYQFEMDTVLPTAPTISGFDLDATETSSSTLNWSAGTDDVAVGSYMIAIGTSSGAIDISDFQDVGNLTSGIVSGLSIVDGQDYFSSILTVDTAGNRSTPVNSDAWRVPGPPEAIHSLAATSALKNQITVGWSAPYHNGSLVTDYLVEYRPKIPVDSLWILLADGVGVDTTATINALTPSTEYEFKVRAYNGSTSPDSNILTVETAPDDPFFEPNVNQAMNLGGASTSIVAAFDDDTEIYLNDVLVITLAAGETHEFTSSVGDLLRSDKAFFVSGRLTNGTPGNTVVQQNGNIVWNSPDWAGKEFIFTGTRDPNHIVTVYAFEDADISIFRGATEDATASLTKGDFHTFSLSNNGSFNMTSDGLILAYMYSQFDGSRVSDPKPLLPASNDVIGFASNTARVATAEATTALTLHHSDSHTESTSVSAGADFSIPSRGSGALYGGESLRIIGADQIVANSHADSNGYCSAPFIPTSMLKKRYVLNTLTDYVAFASLEAGQITREDPDGTITLLDLERTGLNPLAPFKRRISNVAAGTKFSSTTRFGAWYQPLGDTPSAADDDETIMFGFD